MTPALKSCPFCGDQPRFCMCGNAASATHEGCHRIECSCGIQFDWLPLDGETLDELRQAVAIAWNRRA